MDSLTTFERACWGHEAIVTRNPTLGEHTDDIKDSEASIIEARRLGLRYDLLAWLAWQECVGQFCESGGFASASAETGRKSLEMKSASSLVTSRTSRGSIASPLS